MGSSSTSPRLSEPSELGGLSLSAADKMRMHLRVLYSADLTKEAPSIESLSTASYRQFMETFDCERLIVERRQRIADLIGHCRRQCEALWRAAGDERLANFMSAFAGDESFWEPRGRSLSENFCLFATARFTASGEEGLADLARLVGVVCGLSAAPDQQSPWPSAKPAPAHLRTPRVVATEAFVSSFDLLDSDSKVSLGRRRNHPVLAFVLCFEDRSMIVGSEDLA